MMTPQSEERLCRTALVAGDEMMHRLADLRVLLVGVGGVGAWCAEALVRSGVGHLTIVDSDTVAVSNINRQLVATTATVGRPKVEVLAERLRDINPDADIRPLQMVYDASTAPFFELDTYNYIIDAIDSLQCKADLILRVAALERPILLSSMGAALKLSASKIEVAEFWKVKGCPLARALRQRFKKSGEFPRRKFRCVYSPEVLANRKSAEVPIVPTADDTWSARKAAINGTFAHTTAIFGFTLAGLVIEDLYRATQPDTKSHK